MMESRAVVQRGEIDVEIVLQRLNGDRALFASLAAFFLEDSPTLVAALHEGIESHSLPQVIITAHSLSGLASTFEAKSFTRLAAEIECLGRQGDFPRLKGLMHQLDAEFASLTAELQRLVTMPSETEHAPVR